MGEAVLKRRVFEEGDLVKIVRRKVGDHVPADAIGMVGFVEKVDPDGRRVSFQGIKLNGDPSGSGSVHVSRLKRVMDPVWLTAKRLYDAWVDKLLWEAEERRQRWRRVLADVALQYEVTAEAAEAIHRELSAWLRENRGG